MNCLITGGAGFIGSHLIDSLLEYGYSIVCVDDLSLGKMENIYHHFDNHKFMFAQVDILDDNFENIFKENKFDIVFHMAANSDIAMGCNNPDVDFNKTFMTTYKVLMNMKKYKINNIIFASSSAIYGDTKKLLNEESGPLTPISHYGAAKLSSEAFISSFAENYNQTAWIVRFPNVVGGRATHGVVHDLIKKLNINKNELEILGNGEQTKPYLYVKDLIEAIFFISEKSNSRINIFNVGVESRAKVKEIVEIIIDELKVSPKIRYTGSDRGWVGDVPEFRYDLSKIQKLGWKANYSSTEAIRKAVREIASENK